MHALDVLDERFAQVAGDLGAPFNLGEEFDQIARIQPQAPAVIVAARGRRHQGQYERLTFAELQMRSRQYAAGLQRYGLGVGDAVLFLTKPTVDLIPAILAVWRIGAVLLALDPGAAREQKLAGIKAIAPKGMIGIPLAHLLRLRFRDVFRSVTHTVTTGDWSWAGPTLRSFRDLAPDSAQPPRTAASSHSAIVFTSGSTGEPKGVVYTHATGAAVLRSMQRALGIGPGDVSLACHPIFALYHVGMGATVVIPPLDPRFPAKADPDVILRTIHETRPNVAFIPLSTLHKLCDHCAATGVRIPSLKKIVTTGAPVSPALVRAVCEALAEPDGDLHVMYGATEALSMCYASGAEILTRSEIGKGTYLGRPSDGLRIEVIRMTAGPIETWRDGLAVPAGAIGEICAAGPVVTTEYKNRPDATRLAKIDDRGQIWHRTGDAGYVDPDGGLWYCGRLADRVETPRGCFYTELIEPVFNAHPAVRRSALVRVPDVDANGYRPVLVVEPAERLAPARAESLRRELLELAGRQESTREITTILITDEPFPVDVRHNAKIRRDLLAARARQAIDAGHQPRHDMRVPPSSLKSLQFNGATIRYREAGTGEPLLFLHNAGNDHRIWDHQIERFARTHRVIAVDSLGYGASDHPAVEYGLPMYTEMVRTIVDALALAPVTVVGNCTGAAMALNFALQTPEKVKRLILFNLATERAVGGGNLALNCRLLSGRPRLTRIAAATLGKLTLPRAVTRVILRGQFGSRPPHDPEYSEHIHGLYTRPSTVSTMVRLFGQWESFRPLDQLRYPEDGPPLHLFWGEKNRVLPAARGREICARLSPTTAEFLEGCGHLAMREAPAIVNSRIEELIRP